MAKLTKEEKQATAIAVALGIAEGWVLAKLWYWFATPLGAPRIGTFHAAGLNLLWTVFAMRVRATDKAMDFEDHKKWASILVGVLMFGWAYHWIAFR